MTDTSDSLMFVLWLIRRVCRSRVVILPNCSNHNVKLFDIAKYHKEGASHVGFVFASVRRIWIGNTFLDTFLRELAPPI